MKKIEFILIAAAMFITYGLAYHYGYHDGLNAQQAYDTQWYGAREASTSAADLKNWEDVARCAYDENLNVVTSEKRFSIGCKTHPNIFNFVVYPTKGTVKDFLSHPQD